ncbi:peroxisome assembly protein 12-like [Stylophora pistillata]|uniref:Peroxisome assembly protein 12 n=1 Tax=Stylophora pistillata TaxID=50429 RepID=A0A2B4S975_STYPI|nr:peroxisome assembly protein 12-like [Stylophora pistillata]PFX25015.1 Peroxisome assembly protein 12 [Stylophora pistillata]
MAEFAAHLNQGTLNAQPTIFEIIAQESMASVLRPAVTYALKVLASSNPDKWGWIWRFGDELHLFFDYVVQNHYLKIYRGSISEHFYGLKRVSRTPNHDGDDKLSSVQRYLSLVMLVVLPYAKLKLDQLFERLREERVTGSLSSLPVRKRLYFLQLKRIFIYLYPYLHCTWELMCLCYYLLYIFKISGVHSPVLHIVGISLKRFTKRDIVTHNLQRNLPTVPNQQTLGKQILAIPSSALKLLSSVLANGLPVVVFSLKFLEWWYSSDNRSAVHSVMQLPVPPPPARPKPAQYGVQLPPHPAQCPLCNKVRTNPTALSSSGYVFCYPCIHKYLNQHGCCPVTHLPSATKQLVRLYVDDVN